MQFDNELKRKLNADQAVLGARTKTLSPVTVEVFAELGFDFVWVDLEHFGPGPRDSHAIGDLVRAADAAGTELLVRVPNSDPATIRKMFDTGVRTVLVSRVDTEREARESVRAARFAHDGRPGERGSGSARANVWGLADDEYYDREDRNTMIGVMLETETAVENVDDILSVSDLGFAFLGPGDLSLTMGHPGNSDHPDVQQALERLRDAARARDVPLGCVASSPDAATDAIEDGFQVLRVADEIDDLVPTLREKLDAIESAEER